MGKGYGINLADSDGFQVDQNSSLRSPHSVSLDILARSGVPGLIIWIILQLSWGYNIFKRYWKFHNNENEWASLFLFLFAFWVAFLINASFDVFLEGPMGGIWFWSVFGFGLTAMQFSKIYNLKRYFDPKENVFKFSLLKR